MAYKYKKYFMNDSYYGYVEFNITPDFGVGLGIGDVVTINGSIRWNEYAIKCIEVNLGYPFGYINKSISKGKAGSFSISLTVTQEFLNQFSYSHDNSLVIYVYSGADKTGQLNSTYSTAGDPWSYYVIKTRRNPTRSAVDATDRHAAVSGTDTPLDFFGGYAAGQSLPTLTATFATDSHDEKLTTTHRLTITDGGGATVYDGTVAAPALATEAAFDLQPFAAAGTYAWTWLVTDSAGKTASDTGTFTVLAYSPPAITAFTLTRYRHDSVSGQDVADAAGDRLWVDLDGAVAAVASKNAWTLKLDYGEVDGGTSTLITFDSGSDGQTLDYDSDDTLYVRGMTFSASAAWAVTVTLTDVFGSGNAAQASFIVPKAGAYFDIEKTGVAVGMRSTGEAGDKKFEVAEDYTSHFYGGIGTLAVDWKLVTDIATLGTGVETPGRTWSTSKLRIGKIGSHVFMRGDIYVPANNYSSTGKTRDNIGVTIAELPMSYMPSNIDSITDGGASNRYFAEFWLLPISGANIARVCLNFATGRLFVEWVRKMSDGSIQTAASNWMQVEIDWWID